jgi:hypothetical protein
MYRLLTAVMLSVIALSLGAKADGLRYSSAGMTSSQVETISSTYGQLLMRLNGFASMATTACEENTGVEFYLLPREVVDQSLFVNCIVVGLTTDESVEAFKVLFPSKIGGVFVRVRKTSIARMQ